MSSSYLAAIRFPDGHTLFSVFDEHTGRIEPSLVTQPGAGAPLDALTDGEYEQWTHLQQREHGCDPETRIRRLFMTGSRSLLGAIAELADSAEDVVVEVPARRRRWRSRAHRQTQLLLTELNPLPDAEADPASGG
ncbi:hypothetical protein OOT46_13735 [Aquabacterium sp. A7-Y]|uniref:hypothetical protein n=1 Tax=Aquabacterium sp. A7-Y TaxID=1349605 RepID=UPI00223D4D07|nr:hypothetical protein [Aquabacterium sp. A7-Y]MCW7538902.1 hypothetical protein [Aquabacterium sp. A7-Y]